MSDRGGGRDRTTYPPMSLQELEGGFFDGEGNLRPKLLDDVARGLGERFAQFGMDRVSNAQLRRFYGDLKELQKEIRADAEALREMQGGSEGGTGPAFRRYEARIRMLKSKVAYAAGRRTIPASFEKFISRCIDMVDSLRAFDACVTFLESVVGYFYGFGGERNR